MENDLPEPRPPPVSIGDAGRTLDTIKNLLARRRNTGALRTMFASSDAKANPTSAVPAGADSRVEGKNSGLRMPSPSI